MSDGIYLTTAEMLELVASGGCGVVCVDLPVLLQKAAKELREKEAELAAERERNAAPSEYDLALLAERDALRAQLDEAREALEWLVTLKDEKDTHGKTPLYEARKKAAWASARAMLDKIKGDGDEGL